MIKPTPLLLISDAPTAGSGLGRITADISSRVAANLSDTYRIATCGYGGIASRHLPCPHYTTEAMDGWIIPTLPEIWADWAGDEQGVIMFISDPSRLGWFSRPEMCDDMNKYPSLKKFLINPTFQRWIYVPLDASGPNDRLTWPLAQNLLGFDRILAYGKFGEDVIRRTLGEQESKNRGLTILPHGINSDVFYPRDRKEAREFFFALTGASTLRGEKKPIERDEVIINCVCTNQARKDIPLLVETVAILSRQRKVRLHLHTDTLERAWSIPALLLDYGLIDRTLVSIGHLPDEAMAQMYSAADISIAPGTEGWGFPVAESLACGVPVVHGSYGGGADILPSYMQVDPVAFRYESIWACKRPVYNPEDWAKKATCLIGLEAFIPARYTWDKNWVGWEKWFDMEAIHEEL